MKHMRPGLRAFSLCRSARLPFRGAASVHPFSASHEGNVSEFGIDVFLATFSHQSVRRAYVEHLCSARFRRIQHGGRRALTG